MRYLFLTAAAIVSAMALRQGYFSAICLSNALRDKRSGVNHFNYLKWEMPHNDIENEIRDEICVNILYLAGLVMWFVSLLSLKTPLPPIYIAYMAAAAYLFFRKRPGLTERYSEYHDFFSTKTRREDFSDQLVIYGLRIEGTLGKLKKSLLFGFVGIAYCLAAGYICR